MASKRKTYGQGCKCKNTNCFNRNCVCFAAKLICTGACSCKECFNRLDYAFTSKEGREKKQKKGCLCRVTNCWTNKCSCYACVGCDNDYGKRGDNLDMIIGTSTRLYSDMVPVNQFTHLSSVTNIPYIQSPAESINPDMMIGTSTREFDLNLPTVDQLEDMNRCRPQDFDASTDDDRKL